MGKDMFLVVDVQNVYVDGKWKCLDMDRIIANINTIKKRVSPDDVYFTLFIASENPEGTWIKYNRENKEVNDDVHANLLCEMLDTSRVPEKNIIYKHTYSSFKAESVKSIIDSKRYDRIVVCGVTAGCCVLATVFDLVDAGIPVIYIKDAVGQHTEGTGGYVEKILSSLDVHVTLMNTKEYIDSI
ncbi:MAG: cysteine hydrolase [Oscillospiraceae bacterium]|nr:cysteine hydrolase [Oscillospiraceae bacterium]MBQ9981716.1 cysteine hydrolase [Oscillospiraceae bacterium]